MKTSGRIHLNIQTSFILLPTLYFCCFFTKRSDWKRKSLFYRNPQDKPTVIDSANWEVPVVLSNKMRFLYYKYKLQNYSDCCWNLSFRTDWWTWPGLPSSCPHTITLLLMAWQSLKLNALLQSNSLVISSLLRTSVTMLERSLDKGQHEEK